jgi:hypothetical protein
MGGVAAPLPSAMTTFASRLGILRRNESVCHEKIDFLMANAAIIWALAAALAAPCFARAVLMKENIAAQFLWYALGTFFLLGAAFLWISLEPVMLVQHRIVVGVIGAIFGVLGSLAIAERIRPTPAADPPQAGSHATTVRNAVSDTQSIKILPPSMGGNETLRLDHIATMVLVDNSLMTITLALDSTPVALDLKFPPEVPIKIEAPKLTDSRRQSSRHDASCA